LVDNYSLPLLKQRVLEMVSKTRGLLKGLDLQVLSNSLPLSWWSPHFNHSNKRLFHSIIIKLNFFMV
jgi:hypothetical protein